MKRRLIISLVAITCILMSTASLLVILNSGFKGSNNNTVFNTASGEELPDINPEDTNDTEYINYNVTIDVDQNISEDTGESYSNGNTGESQSGSSEESDDTIDDTVETISHPIVEVQYIDHSPYTRGSGIPITLFVFNNYTQDIEIKIDHVITGIGETNFNIIKEGSLGPETIRSGIGRSVNYVKPVPNYCRKAAGPYTWTGQAYFRELNSDEWIPVDIVGSYPVSFTLADL